jgi:uncharacterized protein (DUF1697 family)
MTRMIAFLRAVNVGGRRMKMDRLRAELAGIGIANVETFIASGNVLFDADTEAPDPEARAALERRIEAQIVRAFGFASDTFIRTASELATIAAQPPAAAPDDTIYVGFLHSEPGEAAAARLHALQTPVDRLELRGPAGARNRLS